MDKFETARRKSQLIAERTAEKARNRPWARDQSNAVLWRAIHDALQDSEHLRKVLGHSDRVVAVVLAEQALEELRMRGTQTQLPI